MRRPMHFVEDLLGHVLRLRTVAEQPVRQPEHQIEVAIEELPERLGIPRRDPFEHGARRRRCPAVGRTLGGGRTRMAIESAFPDAAAMEQLLAMGMEQGLTAAVGQIDAILAADAAGSRR